MDMKQAHLRPATVAHYLHFVDAEGNAAGGVPSFWRVLPPEQTAIGWEIVVELRFGDQLEFVTAARIDSGPDAEARVIAARAKIGARMRALCGLPDSAGFFDGVVTQEAA